MNYEEINLEEAVIQCWINELMYCVTLSATDELSENKVSEAVIQRRMNATRQQCHFGASRLGINKCKIPTFYNHLLS